jgi:hypothetical protein
MIRATRKTARFVNLVFWTPTHVKSLVKLVLPSKKHTCDPDGVADTNLPVFDSETGDDKFERQHDSPLQAVVPAHGKTPRGINEAGGVRVETTRDREHDSEFTKGVADVENHDTDDTEADEESGRATGVESSTGTDEETSTN